jgi:disulfide bond formation protein DsbB
VLALTTDAVVLFLALLSLAAQATVVATVVLAVAGRISPARRFRDGLIADLAPSALALASVVAFVAMVGSLYLSEVAHFVPCRLCWYQRMVMYPLGPALAFLAWRRMRRAEVAATVLAAVGVAISSYHVLLERYPTLESGMCDPKNPCTLIWVRRFGYLTIPGMALSGFLLIITLLVVARSAPRP